jgi:integrase
MRIFKTSYKARGGQTKKAPKFYIELRDHLQTIRRFSGFKDKKQTEALGKQIERLINYRVAGEQPDAALTKWLSQIPDRRRQRFVEIGLLDPERASGGKPLMEHIEDFRRSLLAKGDTEKHAKLVVSRVRRIVTNCKFTTWADIAPNKVQRYLAELRDEGNGISAQTFNFYLQSIKEFGRWMVQNRRASENPLQYLKGLNVRTDRRHDRRALPVDEIRRLLETTAAQPERFGMSGPQRSLLYRFSIETGLRANELRSLKVSSFDLKKRTVTVAAVHSKRRREDILPLRKDTAADLQGLVKGKLPAVRIFNMPKSNQIVKMFRMDLKATGIPYVDESGRYADFHALRHCTASLLASANVHPKLAQAILRHSKVDLTLSRYSHVYAGQTSEAVENLPDLSQPSIQSQQAVKTGTDNSAFCLALLDGEHRTALDSIGQVNLIGDKKTQKSKAAPGFEPGNNGFANRRLGPLGYAADLELS